jgi:hypothetical protein
MQFRKKIFMEFSSLKMLEELEYQLFPKSDFVGFTHLIYQLASFFDE